MASLTLPPLSFFANSIGFARKGLGPAIDDRRTCQSYSYRDLVVATSVLKRTLLGDKVDLEQERVAILCPSGFSHVVAQWTVWAAGGIAVPLCTTHPLPEQLYCLQEVQVTRLLGHAMFEQRIELLKEKTGMTTHVLSDNAIAALVANERESSSTVDGLPELTDTHIKGQRSALILFTSGTTGQPKGVVSTHGALEAQTSTLVKAWQWTHLDRIHHTLPLHHIHGIINALACALYSGATVEMYEKFDSQQVWWRWLATLQPTSSFAEQESPLTLFMSVPTVYSRLIAHYNGMEESQRPLYSKACQQFRCMVSGSASLPTPLRDTWHALSNHVLLERYGMTEIGMALSQGYAVEERVQGTVGLPLPGVQVRLIAHDTDTQENGKDVTNTRNVSGMIEVKGTHVFKEYWGRPEATQKEMTREGWFITGDIAIRVEEQGYYKILGRNSIDIIKSGGEKVSALEVERELLSCHLGIEDVAVIGISDMEWGQRVAAVVVMEKEKTLTLQTMRDTLKQRVAVYKVPVYLCTVPELPKNAMGKVMKKQLSCLFA